MTRTPKPQTKEEPSTLLQRLRKPRILARVALAIITGFSSGVGQAVAKSVLPEGRLEGAKAKLEKFLADPDPDGTLAPSPTADDQREALRNAPVEHLHAVASSQGIKHRNVDRDDLVNQILASQRSELRGPQAGPSTISKRPRGPWPPKRKADLQRQQRQMGKRKSR